ncbi:uncharacterized protein LOC132203206 isoform X2 [Neocloeon triangulifer]|uniref:uncharacterized protein LOC132203206 isoform X2 n=1 Tax=Neocloeon triangulifer TaxID=2078957 RepID=UPI00286ECB4F|nr:uncharacterized protein LOC132203206 isoform X2 [Neocloeon triangulifer]
MDEIDRFKENIQPLRQGRITNQLCEALSECKQQKHLAQMQQFEMNLRSYEGDDPLQPWFDYISWMEQTSTGRGKQFREILKQCLKTFSGVAQYHNDSRFIDLWLKFLSVQPNRLELYETVLGHGIAHKSANFYIRWAADLESAGDLKGANKIFQRALDAMVEPQDVLEQAMQRFHCRAAKVQPEEQQEVDGPQRAIFGRLEARSDGRVAAERAQARPLGSNRPFEKQAIKEMAAFPVFNGSENEKPRRQLMKELPDERGRIENEVAPSRWTDAASGKDVRPLVTTPFKVLEDPASAVAATPRSNLGSKRVLQEVKQIKHEAEWPLAYFEPANDKSKPMYCKDKVYCGGTEFSFEELRAESWRKRKLNRQIIKDAKDDEVKVQRKEVIMYETVRDGQEWSYEEIRAQNYLAKIRKNFECPVALFEPENPNQVRMYEKHKVYADNTEYSLEELRAKDWLARSSQSGLLCQSALLGQSMTVHTREALAAVQDLWKSTRESPPATPPKMAFEIFCDDKKDAPAFEIFSDPPKQVPFEIYSENQENVGVKEGVGPKCQSAPFAIFSDNAENEPQYFGGSDKRRVLVPKIVVGEVEQEEEEVESEDEDNNDDEEFEPKPLPPLPELPFVPPPEHWEANGPEGKENFDPSVVNVPKKSLLLPEGGFEDEDTCFVVGPLGNGPVNYLEDITINLMKKPPPSDSSTPFHHQPQSLIMQPQETRHTIILSPILEMTGESRGSRSGSSSSGASTASSKAFSLYLKTPGQSVAGEADHITVPPVKLELLEEEPEVSQNKENSLANVIDDPWSNDLRQRLVAYPEGVSYLDGLMPVARANQAYRFGKKALKLKKCLGEGAYGKVYLTNEPLVLKMLPNDTSGWEIHMSRTLRKRIPAHLMDHFCEISMASIFSNGTILEMPFKSEITLLNVINYRVGSLAEMSEFTKAFLVYEVLLITDALLQAKIIHADIKPDNFLVVPMRHSKGFKYHLQIIDFGRSIDLSLLPSDVQFSPTLKGDARCVAMRQQRPWGVDLDLYSAAATAHAVLFGKYLTLIDVKSVWKPTCKPKRFWQLASVYEKMFEILINAKGDDLQVIQAFLEPILKRATDDVEGVNNELIAACQSQD